MAQTTHFFPAGKAQNTFRDTGLRVFNPANTFRYTLAGAAIGAHRVLNLPLITGTDTLASLALAQTFTAAQTVGAAFTVGSDGTGYDVTFNSGTAGDNFLWDASEEKLVITGTNGATAFAVADGNATFADDLTVTGATVLNGNVTLGSDGDDVITVNGTVAGANAVVFEGATAGGDANETTLAVVDPDADRTIYMPNQSGYLGVFAADTSAGTLSATVGELNILDGATVVVAEVNYLDLGATAVGTAIASKAVVLDANKDYTGLRNFTVSGELDAATLDLSSSADIAGDLVLSGGGDGALQFTNAGENSIKIPDNQASALIIEEADNAYITFVTTDGSEAITVAKATTFSGGIANTGTIAAGTWQGTAIASAYIAADAITGAKIANDAIDSEHYAAGSIDNEHLADDAVDSDELAAGSIDTAHIANDQVTLAKMAGLTRGSMIIGDSSGNPSELTKGSANYVLTSDGTDIAWAAGASGDITSIVAGTGLSGSSLTSGDATPNVDAAQTGINSILATDLVLGEDAQTKIDFETANEIHFDTDNTERMTIDSAGTVSVTDDFKVEDGKAHISSGFGTSGDVQLKMVSTSTSGNARLHLGVPANSLSSGDPTIVFQEGAGDGTAGDKAYWMSYLPNGGYMRLMSYTSVVGDIWRAYDDGVEMRLNANLGSNFDYVCQTCGKHELEKFECCGEVLWQNDVELMALARKEDSYALEMLHKEGVIKTYGPTVHDDIEGGEDWRGYDPVTGFMFTMSAMVQMHDRIKDLETRLLQEAK